MKIGRGSIRITSLYSKDDSISLDEDGSDDDTKELFFMEIEEKHENENPKNEVNAKVDLEGENISALGVLRKLRNNNKNIKKKLLKYEEEVSKDWKIHLENQGK